MTDYAYGGGFRPNRDYFSQYLGPFGGAPTSPGQPTGPGWQAQLGQAAMGMQGGGGMMGGIGSGAGTGAMIGSAFGPAGAGVGALIGGGAGLIGGLLGLRSRSKQRAEMKKAFDEWKKSMPGVDASRYDKAFQEHLANYFAQYGLGGSNRINPQYNREYYTNPHRDQYFANETARRGVPSTFQNFAAPQEPIGDELVRRRPDFRGFVNRMF